QVKRGVPSHGLILSSLAAGCVASSAASHRTSTAPAAHSAPYTAPSQAKHATPPEATPPSATADVFFVQASSGDVEARSAAGGAKRVLAKNVDAAIYDPALELIWIVAQNTLSAIDLRKDYA